ncbi:hypothetical protein D3C75_1270070 [compost metagenome]
MQIGEEAASDVDIARLASFRKHAMTILWIEMNQYVAFAFASFVGIEDVGKGERGDFLAAKASLKP